MGQTKLISCLFDVFSNGCHSFNTLIAKLFLSSKKSRLWALMNSKRLEISPKNGWRARVAGEPMTSFPNWRCFLTDVRTFFRPKFVGRAEFPPNPPSARPQKRPFRIEKLPKNLKKYRLELHF